MDLGIYSVRIWNPYMGWLDVVLETPMFIIGYDQHCAFPFRTVSKRFVHIFEEALALKDIRNWMLPVR
jgi:hypothetical protein